MAPRCPLKPQRVQWSSAETPPCRPWHREVLGLTQAATHTWKGAQHQSPRNRPCVSQRDLGECQERDFLGKEMKLAAPHRASGLPVAKDPVPKWAPAGFASAAVNRRCSCPCSHVPTGTLRSWLSRIGVSNMSQRFWGQCHPAKGGGSERAARLEHRSKSSCLKWFGWLGTAPYESEQHPLQSGIWGSVGGPQHWTGRDAVGCSRRDVRSQRANHPGTHISCCFAITPAAFPHVPASRLSNRAVSAGKKGTFWHGTGRAAQPRCAASPPASHLLCSIPQKQSLRATPKPNLKMQFNGEVCPSVRSTRNNSRERRTSRDPCGNIFSCGVGAGPRRDRHQTPSCPFHAKNVQTGEGGFNNEEKAICARN